MPNWRRSSVAGGSYFFTVVTHRRMRLFRRADFRDTLGAVLRECRERWPFDTDAIVLLPDHLHVMWTLPAGDFDYSRRWAWIKKEVTVRIREQCRQAGVLPPTRLWQAKFWEHTVRDEEDYRRHLDYVHYNPVKHRLVSCPWQWPWSSFHRHVAAGTYERNWACGPRADEVRQQIESMNVTVGE